MFLPRASNVTVCDLPLLILQSEGNSDLKKPADGFYSGCYEDYSTARHIAAGCLRWIWTQWLSGAPKANIREKAEFVARRGVAFHKLVRSQKYRGLHDLFLINGALYACDSTTLRYVAENVVEAAGDDDNDGEFHARAWCGALKYLVFGDTKNATAQYKLLAGTYCPHSGRTANKTFLRYVLNERWTDFVSLQQKDFHRLWARSLRDGTVRSVMPEQNEVIVRLAGFPIEQLWSWSQVGLALFAHRKGISVATDPLWLPPHALHCVDTDLAN